MLAGTGSGVGKSLLVAGLARALTRRGLSVRPFKPQNMSNNAAVTADGGEIGRAQALQARAAGVAATADMNPVLLKPHADGGAQIIVQGKLWGQASGRAFQSLKPQLLPRVLESFARLRAGCDIVLVEGAGSVAEANLRPQDIANMGFARAASVPVVLIGDIDRGGVIASLIGTRAVLEPDDAALVGGFIVNRMRGDLSLFADGMAMIAARTGWPGLGLVAHFAAAQALPAEDAADLAEPPRQRGSGGALRIAAPMLPGIANFDDLDPLRAEPGVDLRLIPRGRPLPVGCALLILPGSKTTLADLAVLRAEGWDIDLLAHRRQGGRILGLCGGYQMLGQTIADPHGLEGPPGEAPGLGLLAVATTLGGDKRLVETAGATPDGVRLSGYEMHLGRTDGPDAARPFARLDDGRPDGARSADGLVCGSYLHRLFDGDAQRAAWLHRLGAPASPYRHTDAIETTLDALAVHLERHVDIAGLLSLAR